MHPVEAFKLSPDPQFIEKVRDIVGLYLNPSDAAVVLCVNEKSQIQAPDRTAPVLLLRPGIAERRRHDYVRNGTTNLYAALDVASGNVIADLNARHRASEFRKFLNLINRSVPAELDVHVIVDNSSTHKTREIHRAPIDARARAPDQNPDRNLEREPEPFVWHKTADEILDTLAGYCARISESGH